MDIYQQLPIYPTDVALPVRFLQLFPAPSQDADIQCELCLSSLSGPDDFEALSYTWGSPENPVTIMVQSHPRQVTQNLAAALRRMRHVDKTRLLWVDALCINQADEAEKSLQVAQMRQVYTSKLTKQVNVWLGEGGSARVALGFFETLSKAEDYNTKYTADTMEIFPGLTDVERLRVFERLRDKLDQATDAGMTGEDFIANVATPAEKTFLTRSKKMAGLDDDPVKGIESLIDGYDAERAACDEFFARPWWSRTWILQEAIHDRKVSVYIGDLDPIPIDDLCRMAARYQRYINIRTGQLRNRAAGNSQESGTWFTEAATNFALWLFISGTARTTVDTILTLREKYAAEGEAAAAPLRELLLQLRNQLATDPRDKVYGLLGFSTNEYDIDPDYSRSKEELYIMLTRRMMRNVLYVLLWVESPGRKVEAGNLPSWVPDHSTPQTFKTITINQQWYKLSANKGFPSPEPATGEPHLSQGPDEKTLILRGIRVGHITEVFDVEISSELPSSTENTLRLFGYEAAGVRYNIEEADGTPGTTRTASWGPCHCLADDIIVVVPGSSMPLVLRRTTHGRGGHLFVGACWLVNSELQDVHHLEKDPGFSPIMYGSACASAREDDVELFRIQ
ncbi:heterokaryon incompatibility protein-domain-containing protein [Plectosphaerella plurivora]|uniref:Heterokaryon incompatibility protein-domain-containing protein n=1 Tax=Plectosphaerella plurivora TaxID=936078 RepID=A0A9P8V882_9PEZI|nr:heterokaryon incompatibility protein-domain-containing protein [Plectosphaerella plurivora]